MFVKKCEQQLSKDLCLLRYVCIDLQIKKIKINLREPSLNRTGVSGLKVTIFYN